MKLKAIVFTAVLLGAAGAHAESGSIALNSANQLARAPLEMRLSQINERIAEVRANMQHIDSTRLELRKMEQSGYAEAMLSQIKLNDELELINLSYDKKKLEHKIKLLK